MGEVKSGKCRELKELRLVMVSNGFFMEGKSVSS
jgi:hypothetical protein